jgi:hypothetical protein
LPCTLLPCILTATAINQNHNIARAVYKLHL